MRTIAALILLVAGALPALAAGPYDYAVVTKVVYPGQKVEQAATDIRQHTVEIPDGYPVLRARADLAGMVAVKTLLPGRAIAPDMVREPHAVEAGTAVSVRLVEGPLTIEMKAVALEDGAVGDSIRVRNADNGRSICAVVRAAATVEAC
ncbi:MULTISPECIES: flagellar basal body P-ring formation chaperone FlgA [unclassified Roseitalea]|uniref:flagellar basal body P-ring formation chaperone FlgA n=1 Tax=unclassified Roseitalea TaxID=2639107 RepID=UPI00273D1A0E|nr:MULTISPECIES: flagellar basal body P-ring formation chaperone FlgA [unclassified Roseitalea]